MMCERELIIDPVAFSASDIDRILIELVSPTNFACSLKFADPNLKTFALTWRLFLHLKGTEIYSVVIINLFIIIICNMKI